MDRKKLIVVGGVLLIAVFIFFYFTSDRNTRTFNWQENLRVNSQQPYGTFIFHQLMKVHFEDSITYLKSSVSKNLSASQQNSLYMMVGKEGYYENEDIDSLFSFVKAGNAAFIASSSFPYDISYQLFEDQCGVVDFFAAETVTMQLENEQEEYNYTFFEKHKPITYYWGFIDSVTCFEQLEVLGRFDQTKVNFIKASYGDGHFFFYTSPLVFTNYYLKDEKYLKYVESLLAYLPKEHIYWDEYSKLPSEPGDDQNSPLSYILSQPALKWAWYLLLAGVVVYFIFYAKRKQRIIPVLATNRNTSIEFAETMAYLYFEEQNHKKIADHKMNLFLAFIRHKYNLHTNVIDDQLIKKISMKSQIAEDEVRKIFKEYDRLDFKVEIAAQDLIAFHDMIESFYQKSK